jgi:hypothetical protein
MISYLAITGSQIEYIVAISSDGGSQYTTLVTTPLLSYTATALEPSVQYILKVTATNVFGDGSANTVSAVTVPTTGTPYQPYAPSVMISNSQVVVSIVVHQCSSLSKLLL